MCNIHVDLEELQTVSLMLQIMTFHSSAKVLTLFVDNSTPYDYFCNQGGMVSPVISILAC